MVAESLILSINIFGKNRYFNQAKNHYKVFLKNKIGIETIKGMIMDTAPLNSEAIAVWMCSGFNTLNAIWRFEIKEKNIQLELIHPNDFMHSQKTLASAYNSNTNDESWRLPFETLWKITNQNHSQLKYIYILPIPEDRQLLEKLDEIDILIRKCFTILKENHINSVSLILIPALPIGEFNTNLADIKSARQMINSINYVQIKK